VNLQGIVLNKSEIVILVAYIDSFMTFIWIIFLFL